MNSVLNYLYAVLESETQLAVAALGLDPGLGVLHVDSQFRDTLAFDVMEPVRPKIDAYLLEWIRRETLKREWFFEQRDGNCRLMGSFAVRLFGNRDRMGASGCPGRRASRQNVVINDRETASAMATADNADPEQSTGSKGRSICCANTSSASR